jgi:exodeoxyribonuclease V gamma subunit
LWLQEPALEDLAHTVWAWWARYPAAPLEDEVVLVPSNGMAEWFKAEAARAQGLLAACRIELPARFAWRLTRLVLGPVASRARRTDKSILPWTLAARVGQWSALPSLREPWAALRSRHADSAAASAPVETSLELLRWCAHAADLLDQYQWFRPDWLKDWAQGRQQLRLGAHAAAPALAMPKDQVWQAELWQWLLEQEQAGPQGLMLPSRAALHEACVRRLREAPVGSLPQLPGRLLLFGGTALPPAVLELVEAVSRHALVIMAVPTPCQAPWAPLSEGPHAGQPLLAAWGQQARDFVAQVQSFEERLGQSQQRGITHVEAAQPTPARSALGLLQLAIHANQPVPETAQAARQLGLRLDDGSIRFVRAHTALREVEILHDYLLHQLTAPDTGERPQARDVVVMVPDLRTHAPAIRAVFGAYNEQDPRHIPWGMADQQAQVDQGLPAWADWLLSLPSQRCTASDLKRLLDEPAVRRRWGWDEQDRQALQSWVEDSGIRWGISAAHRASLGMSAAGQAMTWQFGIDRMLAGYAMGRETHQSLAPDDPGAPFAPDARWAPLDSVRGLAAAAAGQLATLVRRLENWRQWASHPHAPEDWVLAFRALWSDLLQPADAAQERDSQAIHDALASWLRHTLAAEFNCPVGLEWVRWAVQEAHVQAAATGRFRSSGVTFCTLMPLRAVPFRIVCLLGMDEGQYPRPSRPRPGDLMADPAVARPGDRSRRIEDRQLMLDALLSAREQLVVSWIGQQAVDMQHRPPSVLVGHLRDTLAAVWGPDALQTVTLDHPLQPFNPAYFRNGPLPATHAFEWEAPSSEQHTAKTSSNTPPRGAAAHGAAADQTGFVGATVQPPQQLLEDPDRVMRWLRCPVAAFWEERLSLRWPRTPWTLDEDEPLALSGLLAWSAWQEALKALDAHAGTPDTAGAAERLWSSMQAKGLVPLAAPGRWSAHGLLGRWRALAEHTPASGADGLALRVLVSASAFAGAQPWKVDPKAWRLDLLVQAWWLQTLRAAQGEGFGLQLLAPDATAVGRPSERAQAAQDVAQVLDTLCTWMQADRPAVATARLLGAAHRSSSEQRAAWDRECARNPAWQRSFGAWDEADEQGNADEWPGATEALYGPFWRWCQDHLQLVPLAPRPITELSHGRIASPLHWPLPPTQHADSGSTTA